MTPQQVEKEELGRIETIEEVVADDKDCGCTDSIGIGDPASTTTSSQDLVKDASNAIGTKKVACTAHNAAAAALILWPLILWPLSLSSSCSRAGFRRARHSQLRINPATALHLPVARRSESALRWAHRPSRTVLVWRKYHGRRWISVFLEIRRRCAWLGNTSRLLLLLLLPQRVGTPTAHPPRCGNSRQCDRHYF